MRSARVDLYRVLGVARSATGAELRRAYRQMALAHHPDRAGPSSASTFAGIADAYRVLSNPLARSAYDASLVEEAAWNTRGGGAVHAGGVDWNVGTQGGNGFQGANGFHAQGWQAARTVPIPDLLARVSGELADLTASRIIRRGADGVLELHLEAPEAAAGGTAAIRMPLQVVCSSCGGVARPRGVWCRICEHEGRVTEDVTVCIRVPRHTHPGAVLSLSVPRVIDAPIKVRVLVHGLRPHRG